MSKTNMGMVHKQHQNIFKMYVSTTHNVIALCPTYFTYLAHFGWHPIDVHPVGDDNAAKI
jgi:hypothetical protein